MINCQHERLAIGDGAETFVRHVNLAADKTSEDDSDPEGTQQDSSYILDIHQLMVGDVGCVVWDAAIVLSQVLARSEAFSCIPWRDQLVVELGAGTGLVGLATAMLGSEVLLTDLRECIPLMEVNCRVNSKKIQGSARAAVLEWGCALEEFTRDVCDGRHIDLLLMADVIYYDASVGPLLDTIKALCSANTQILMSYEDRTTGNKVELKEQFFLKVREEFLVEELPMEVVPENYRCDEIHIVAMKLRDVS